MVLHTLGAFLATARTKIEREKQALDHYLFACAVLNRFHAEADNWVVPLRPVSLEPLSPDTVLLDSWYFQTHKLWLPAVVCSFLSTCHLPLCVLFLSLIVCVCICPNQQTVFCAGCGCHKKRKHKKDSESEKGSPLRILCRSPALVQAICAFCIPTISIIQREKEEEEEREDVGYSDGDADDGDDE